MANTRCISYVRHKSGRNPFPVFCNVTEYYIQRDNDILSYHDLFIMFWKDIHIDKVDDIKNDSNPTHTHSISRLSERRLQLDKAVPLDYTSK